MSDFLDFFNRSQRALGSVLSNRAGEAIRDIDNPVFRAAAQQLLDTALPGFGGGTPDLSDNTFGAVIADKLTQSFLELENTVAQPVQNTSSQLLKKNYDWRARLRPKKGGEDTFYAAGVQGEDGESGFTDYLLKPIQESGGLIWQHTPSVYVSASAEYNQSLMQGANYPINTYNYSTPPEIPVQADFTANDQYEARYLLAVWTFLKIATKGFYGDTAVANGKYGTPPPVLVFEYLGDHGFNKVPVVVTNYQFQLPNEVDYVPVTVQDSVTWVPTIANVMVNLRPSYTPHKLRKRFDLQAVANGALYKDGFI